MTMIKSESGLANEVTSNPGHEPADRATVLELAMQEGVRWTEDEVVLSQPAGITDEDWRWFTAQFDQWFKTEVARVQSERA